MDLGQLSKLKIPQEQEERNKVLTDALKTKNALLIEFALSIGADPLIGGEEVLEHAVRQGDLQLVKKLLAHIEEGKRIAMSMAMDNDQIEIGTWLSKERALMIIGQMQIKKHWQTVTHILMNSPEAKTDIEYEALFETIFVNESAEVLTILLNSMKRNKPEAMKDCILRLADDTVDTERVDCMEVMVQFGLDVAYVNTKYCHTEGMRKFLKKHGARID